MPRSPAVDQSLSVTQASRYCRNFTRFRHVIAALALLAAGAAAAAGRMEELKDSGLTDKKLVERYCTRCHLEPHPRDLPKEFWPMALYPMGTYVGMKGDEFSELTVEQAAPDPTSYTVRHKLTDKEGRIYHPSIYYDFSLPQPLMSKAEWLRIKDYFVANAASNDELKIRRPKEPLLKGFRPAIPKLDLEANGWALATAVDGTRRRLFVGRGAIARKDGGLDPDSPKDLLAFDLVTGKRLAQLPIHSLPIDIEITSTGARMSTHGLLSVTRNERGSSQVIDWDLSGDEPRVRMLANGVDRLTMHQTLDMNGDALPDILVSAYGDGIFSLPGGLLTVYWQTPKYPELWRTANAEIPKLGPLKGAFRETVLNRTAGLISSAVGDFNNDGRPDIAAMIAQGKQQIIVYLNNGNETFTEQLVAEYPPAYGGNSLAVADLNGDGRPDILAIYGDGPFSGEFEGSFPVFKPGHGIRLFENKGGSTFAERLHYPFLGAVRGVVHDFDEDGDEDIAAIALYPDWSLDEPETFVYLENRGNWKFTPASLSPDAFGIWSSIEVADVDADGRADIVLGLANDRNYVPATWADRKRMAGSRGKAPTVMFLMNENE